MENVIPDKEHQFPAAGEERDYRQFPDELENDKHVLFHGTAARNLRSIVEDGFRPGDELDSVSFANNSSLALGYACKSRVTATDCGCIVAVRFEHLNAPGLKTEQFGIHAYRLNPQPAVIGYCLIPANYVFR